MAWTAMRGGQRSICGVAFGDRKLLEELANLMADGSLRAVIAERYPLERIIEAHERLETTPTRGEIVVERTLTHEHSATL